MRCGAVRCGAVHVVQYSAVQCCCTVPGAAAQSRTAQPTARPTAPPCRRQSHLPPTTPRPPRPPARPPPIVNARDDVHCGTVASAIHQVQQALCPPSSPPIGIGIAETDTNTHHTSTPCTAHKHTAHQHTSTPTHITPAHRVLHRAGVRPPTWPVANNNKCRSKASVPKRGGMACCAPVNCNGWQLRKYVDRTSIGAACTRGKRGGAFGHTPSLNVYTHTHTHTHTRARAHTHGVMARLV